MTINDLAQACRWKLLAQISSYRQSVIVVIETMTVSQRQFQCERSERIPFHLM